MRGTVAKKLRRKARADNPAPARYNILRTILRRSGDKTEQGDTLRLEGWRKSYKELKRVYRG